MDASCWANQRPSKIYESLSQYPGSSQHRCANGGQKLVSCSADGLLGDHGIVVELVEVRDARAVVDGRLFCPSIYSSIPAP
eukprot:719785-Rhodomonas_salina.6